ncbi:MAG TPA: sugar phosphate isomerase/epimerase family protein [Longimicrobiales bacterium]
MREEAEVVAREAGRSTMRPAESGAPVGQAERVEAGLRLAVSSWSLLPRSPRELVERVRAAGLDAVQLALDPVRTGAMPLERLRAELEATGVRVLSGMMATAGEDRSTLESLRRTGGLVPDATWEENFAAAQEDARVAEELGITLVTFHAGFIPPEAGDPRRRVLAERVRRIARVFVDRGTRVALETGQETAATLAEVLAELGDTGVGVNFDPANMILYGTGDPVRALRRLAPWVRQVHIKDAVAAEHPGELGREVPVGEGDVNWTAFFAALRAAELRVDLVIEREAGEQRVADVRRARELVERYVVVER